MERRLSQRMNQLEVNCNANIGEGVAAGIEEVRASISETGKAAFPAEYCSQHQFIIASDSALSSHKVLLERSFMLLWQTAHALPTVPYEPSQTESDVLCTLLMAQRHATSPVYYQSCELSLQRMTSSCCVGGRGVTCDHQGDAKGDTHQVAMLSPFPARRPSDRQSDLLTGKELRDDVAQMQKEVDGAMRALRGEHAAADRALMMQLRAVLEQARDMRVWREQHNVRVLEMQA